MKKIVKKFFLNFGIDIRRSPSFQNKSFLSDYNHKLGYDMEKEANEEIKKVRANTMLPYVRLVTLFQQAVFCENSNITGDFIECGVWKGGAMGLMALANLEYGLHRRQLRLFDAFNDICQPDPEIDGPRAIADVNKYTKDKVICNGELVPVRGIYESFGGFGTIEENIELLENKLKYPSEFISYHKGWFQETIPRDIDKIDKIAILRLDGDWYASIKICMEYLYPKVVKGGFVIIDDYAYYDGCTKAVDEYLNKNKINAFLHHIDKYSRYFIRS